MNPSSTPSRFCPARHNPFRVALTDALPFHFEYGDWSMHWHRLEQLRFRAAIVGPHGSGKTTLLSELARRLARAGMLPVEVRVTSPNPDELTYLLQPDLSVAHRKVLLVDSAEALSRGAWRVVQRLTCSWDGLMVTVHRRCALPTWIESRSSRETLDNLLGQLEIQPHQTALIQRAHALYARHRGNIRMIFRELYDCWSDGEFTACRSMNAE